MPNTENTTEVSLADFDQRVKKLAADLEAFKKHRGAWDVMRYYLKGRGHSWKAINDILGAVEEFMSKFAPPTQKKK